jgi:hypothetical protein
VVVTTGPEQVLADPELGVEAPLDLVDRGAGLEIPKDTEVHTCTPVNGLLQQNSGAMLEAAELVFDAAEEPERLDIVAKLPLVFSVAAASCDQLRYEVTLDASASRQAR